jgi:DNA-binding transcriptional MerR regulator
MDEGLTIAEVAADTGLTAHTLRYYERAGLLEPPQRGGNGHRRYTSRDLGRIRMLTRLRDTGMPIAEVRRYFEFVRAGERTAPERRRLLLDHRAAVAARIAQLQQDLALIDSKIESYEEIEKRNAAVAGPPVLSSPA